jgi:ribosomal-protein-alanine N-acetyltransferase
MPSYAAGKYPETILPCNVQASITACADKAKKNYIVRAKSSNSRPRQSRKPCRSPLFIPLGKADFHEIRSVESAGQKKRWTDGMLRDELSHRHGFHFGARMPPAPWLRAYALCRLFAGELHIHRLCTRPAERRQGYASALLTHVFGAARKKGAEKAFLEVSASNEAAVSLYRRLGFTVDAERKQYYSDGNSAILMSRILKV